MTDFPTDTCRSCGAPIVWTLTVRDRDMPVDAEPVAGGNLQLERIVRYRGAEPVTTDRIRSTVVKSHLAFGSSDLYLSHFAKCPQASKWRTRAKP